jgi:hypoxanthine phosphoribosyltransferase
VGTESSGCVSQLIGLERDVTNRDVIIVEDIVETGTTICAAWEMLKKGNPRSIKIATMMFKPEAYKYDVPIEYYAMNIPGDFIIGCGLDIDGLGRNYPDVYALVED